MLSEKQKKQHSKFLSLVLRHNPKLIELNLDEQGWANIEELIEKSKSKNLHYSMELLQQLVQENDKQRFIIKGDKIRANQGHSVKVDLALEAQTPPSILYHGTATRFLKNIMQEGLIKGSRQHVHLSADIPTALNVGQRHGVPVILEVNAAKMFEHGYAFYLSENKVWLSDKIPAQYIKQLK